MMLHVADTNQLTKLQPLCFQVQILSFTGHTAFVHTTVGLLGLGLGLVLVSIWHSNS